MAEENTSPAMTPAPAQQMLPTNGVGEAEKLVPSFRLEQESVRAREAEATRDEALKTLQGVQEEYERLKSKYQTSSENHEINVHLMQRGITHDSLQRFFGNEWRASQKELAADKRVPFSEWLTANAEDPLYEVHLKRAAAAGPQPAEQAAPPVPDVTDENLFKALRAVLTGNPDSGTGQPAENTEQEWTAEAIRKVRAKNGGTLGDQKDAILAQWRAKKIIK